MKTFSENFFYRWLLCFLSCLVWLLGIPEMGKADSFSVDGTANRFGSLAFMISAFADPNTQDIYPTGQTDFYVFSLFDTGSDQVAIGTSGQPVLGINSPTTTDIRLNGFNAIDPNTLLAPIGSGTGTPQAEVTNITVSAPSNLDPILVGAPVANNMTAIIDYTTIVERGPYSFLPPPMIARAPDLTFLHGPNTTLPTTQVDLELERFGRIGTNASGVNIGERYYLRDVLFSEPTGVSSGQVNRLLYDTGSNVTVLGNTMAQELGLNLNTPDFSGLVGGEQLPGFFLDSITFSGLGGTYTVQNAPVFVNPTAVFGGVADGIIGSNLFAQTSILFNGIENRLGIGISENPPIPEPSTLILFGTGFVSLMSWQIVRKRKLSKSCFR